MGTTSQMGADSRQREVKPAKAKRNRTLTPEEKAKLCAATKAYWSRWNAAKAAAAVGTGEPSQVPAGSMAEVTPPTKVELNVAAEARNAFETPAGCPVDADGGKRTATVPVTPTEPEPAVKDIRPIMDALSAVCNSSGASFVSVVHHNKRSDVDALQKILGASSVVGAARTAWGFSRDPDNKEEFFMSLVKNNLSKRRTGMKYKIAEKTLNGITAPYTDWGAETDETANDLLDAERDTSGRKDNKQITLAREFLPVALSKGPRLAS